MNRKDYPPEWHSIALRIKNKANWKCEICNAAHNTGNNVILTVHHRDGNPQNCNDSNLIALCRRCHLREQLKLQPYIARKQQEDSGQASFIPLSKFNPINPDTQKTPLT